MHQRRPPASMTKLMTAYVVLDKLEKGEIHLTDKVTISQKAARIGGSQVYLEAGETFTIEELMHAIMLASANDAAFAVSEFVSGSQKDFVVLMNEKARSLGMKDTLFQSVHGLPPGKGQTADLTSCYDMTLLGSSILRYPKILEWTSMKKGRFRDGKFTLRNHNKLLWRMPEVDGLKTGFYSAAGYNITATARKGDLRFMVVVMGSPAAKIRDNLALEKFRKYFEAYTTVKVLKKGDRLDKEVFLPDGKYREIKGVVAADLDLPVLLSKKREVKQIINLPLFIRGEVKQGQKLGEAVYQLDNETLGKVAIVSPIPVPKANLFTRLLRKTGLNL